MKNLTGLQTIELKLENGVQQFSPQEVAYLLNTIRIKDEQLKTAKKEGK